MDNPGLEPGDVLFFTEASTHGTLPWSAEHTRRAALYRFAPATSAYGRAYLTRAALGRDGQPHRRGESGAGAAVPPEAGQAGADDGRDGGGAEARGV